MADDDILNLTQVAEMFGVQRTTVLYWVRQNQLPATKAGRSYAIKRSDVDALAQRRRERAAPIQGPEPGRFEAPMTSGQFDLTKNVQ